MSEKKIVQIYLDAGGCGWIEVGANYRYHQFGYGKDINIKYGKRNGEMAEIDTIEMEYKLEGKDYLLVVDASKCIVILENENKNSQRVNTNDLKEDI